jgi:hypothetical protein
MNLTDRIRNTGLTFLVLPRGRAAGEIGVKYLLLLLLFIRTERCVDRVVHAEGVISK